MRPWRFLSRLADVERRIRDVRQNRNIEALEPHRDGEDAQGTDAADEADQEQVADARLDVTCGHLLCRPFDDSRPPRPQ